MTTESNGTLEYQTVLVPFDMFRDLMPPPEGMHYERDSPDDTLNILGAEGWELVQIIDIGATGPDADRAAILKRKIETLEI